MNTVDSRVSVPAVPRTNTRPTDPQATAQARGFQARYAALAAEPDALAKALTGRSLSQLPAQQQAKLLAFSKALKEGAMAWPEWRVVQHSAGGPSAGEGDALFKGAMAAFVPSKGGDGGTALLSKGLAGPAREAAIAEELGEAIAAAAAQSGIEVAAGDRGARLAAALGGRRDFTTAELTARADDSTVVRLDGQLTPALARQAKGPKTLNVRFPGETGFSLRMPANGRTFSLKDGHPDHDLVKGPGEITMKVNPGYTGTVDVVARNGQKVGSIRVKDYGYVDEPVVALNHSATHTLHWGSKPNEIVVRPKGKAGGASKPSPKFDPVTLQVQFDSGPGFKLTWGGKGKPAGTLKDNSPDDLSKRQGVVQMRVFDDYTGTINIVAKDGRTVVGKVDMVKGKATKLHDSATHRLVKVWGAIMVSPRPEPTKLQTRVSVAVADGGYVLVTQGKEKFAVFSGGLNGSQEHGSEYTKLASKYAIRNDTNKSPGMVSFNVPYKSSGTIEVHYPLPEHINMPEAEVKFSGAGTDRFKVDATDIWDGRGQGRPSRGGQSSTFGDAIYVDGFKRSEEVGERIANALVKLDATNFASKLKNIKITTGANSAVQLQQLQDDLVDATNIIAKGVQGTMILMEDVSEYLLRGGLLRDLARKLLGNVPDNLSEDEAAKKIGAVFEEQAAEMKGWLSTNADNIKAAIQNFKSTKKAEEERAQLERILGIVDILAGSMSAIGTMGSAFAAFKSLGVRRQSMVDRLPPFTEKREIYLQKKAISDRWARRTPDNPLKQRYDRETADAKKAMDAAEGLYNTSKSLADIGAQQMKSWAVAVPGAQTTVGSRSTRFNLITTNFSSADLTKIANDIKSGNAEDAKRNAQLLEKFGDATDEEKSIIDSLNLQKTDEWKKFGYALRDGFTTVALNLNLGTLEASIPVRNQGPASKGEMAKRYQEEFDRWKAPKEWDGTLYYFKGRAAPDADRPFSYTDGEIDIYKWPMPFLTIFPR